jgi:hypothetical protein
MSTEMRSALDERRHLIGARADAVLDTALQDNEPWTRILGTMPKDAYGQRQWRQHARVIAAYRDRYAIADTTPLGAPPDSTAQKIDRARVETALRAVAASQAQTGPERRPSHQSARQHTL